MPKVRFTSQLLSAIHCLTQNSCKLMGTAGTADSWVWGALHPTTFFPSEELLSVCRQSNSNLGLKAMLTMMHWVQWTATVGWHKIVEYCLTRVIGIHARLQGCVQVSAWIVVLMICYLFTHYQVFDSPDMPENEATYTITQGGIMDVQD